MINGKRILALIPARGGSKGIKNKNIIDLCGKPLISYTIEAAKESRYIDSVIVSTDSEKIAEVAISCGADVPFLRPAAFALDTSTTIETVCHAIQTFAEGGDRYDVLVLLQPTSPLRTQEDIDGALEKFEREGLSIASVSKAKDSPILLRKLTSKSQMVSLLGLQSTVRRQDMPPVYRVNGSIYINAISSLNENTSFNDNVCPYVMEESHSVDIDDYLDIEIAKYFMERRRKFYEEVVSEKSTTGGDI